MIAELTAAITCMNAITSLTKSLATGPGDVEWKQHVSSLIDNILDLQSKMLSIQGQCQELIDQNQQMKNEINRSEGWRTIAARYSLTEIEPSMFVYVLRKEFSAEEPEHWICPNCFQNQKKSILTRINYASSMLNCPNCRLTICPDT